MVKESETYNPAKFSRDYYFTEHESQVRKVEGLVLIEIERRMLVSMTLPKTCALRNFHKSVKEACRIFSCGFAPSMAIAMVFT